MKKTVFIIGVILLVAFLVTAVIRSTPQFYCKTYQVFDSMYDSNHNNISYGGQNYMMGDYNLSVEARVGDTIQLTVLEHGNNNEVWATAFFEQSDGTPIFAYQTVANYPATYSMIVGNASLVYYGVTKDLPVNQGGGSTTYLVQLGVPQQDIVNGTWNNGLAAGEYLITVNVYSNSLYQTYAAIAVLFLTSGVVFTIVGYALKSKRSEPTPS